MSLVHNSWCWKQRMKYPFAFLSSYKPTPTNWIYMARFLFSYLACTAATALSVIFTADINASFYRDTLHHFCDHQLSPVHFWDIITSALWIKISEQLIKEPSNKQTRWDSETHRGSNCTSGEYYTLSRYLVRAELFLLLLITYVPEKLVNII